AAGATREGPLLRALLVDELAVDSGHVQIAPDRQALS
ncbi:hypothetical protein PSYJA_45666, partial [Pseudomonas syringae pv. japonica str. M301072]